MYVAYLRNDGHWFTKASQVDIVDILPTNKDGTSIGIVESIEEADEGRFATPTLSYHSHSLTWLHL